jgi:5'-nucleotidase
MRILVTNDDGIEAPGLWAAVKELQKVGQVTVVAPQWEQSGVGSSVSLRQAVKVSKARSHLKDVETYSVEGTPADCVIIAINSLFPGKINMVVSGINRGPNIGHDIFVSGTVGAALQGYLHGIPSLAISLNAYESLRFELAAKLTALLVTKLQQGILPREVLLNVNLPNLPPGEIEGMEITTLSKRGYSDIVQQIQDGHYRIMRATELNNKHFGSDIWALQRNRISITPLSFDLDNSSTSSLNYNLQGLVPLLYQ